MRSAGAHILQKADESGLHALRRAVVVEMIGLDIGQHGDIGFQTEKRVVGFAGFRHERARLRCRRAHCRQAPPPRRRRRPWGPGRRSAAARRACRSWWSCRAFRRPRSSARDAPPSARPESRRARRRARRAPAPPALPDCPPPRRPRPRPDRHRPPDWPLDGRDRASRRPACSRATAGLAAGSALRIRAGDANAPRLRHLRQRADADAGDPQKMNVCSVLPSTLFLLIKARISFATVVRRVRAAQRPRSPAPSRRGAAGAARSARISALSFDAVRLFSARCRPRPPPPTPAHWPSDGRHRRSAAE